MKKDKVKDPNKPKRPPSSFFLFRKEFKKTYKKHPNNSVGRVSIDASEKWNFMLKSEKAPYIAKAEAMMAEYKKKMQAYNGGMAEIDVIDDDEEEEEEENLPAPSLTTEAQETDLDLGELVADRFLKFRDAIIKDYLASRTFQKELDEHLEKYKGSEEHRNELARHLERYKKSDDFQKALTQHLERYKKSEDFQRALSQHLETYKKSEKYKKEMGEVVGRYKKSEEFQQVLAHQLEMHKKSEKYKQELADHLEKYKGSKEHKDIAVQEIVGSFLQGLPAAQGRVYDLLRHRFPDLDIASCGFPAKLETASTSSQGSSSSSLVNEIKFLLLLLPFLLPLLLRPTDEEDTMSLRELITKKMT